MKVDVVVATFWEKHERLWPWVSKGLTMNADHIERVILVNDGPPPDATLEGLPLVVLGHATEGFGLCKSLNVGLAEAKTDWVLVIEGDEILEPSGLARTLSMPLVPRSLYCLPKRYLDDESSALDAAVSGKPLFISGDHRDLGIGRNWQACSGGHLLLDRLGSPGFDEGYQYGLHDYDYAVRWMLAHGQGRVVWCSGAGQAWHIGSGKGRELPSKESAQRFAVVASEMFGRRYHLGCRSNHLQYYLNVGDTWVDTPPADWRNPSWIPRGAAATVYHDMVEPLEPHFYEACRKALYPNGELILDSQTPFDEEAIEKMGFDILYCGKCPRNEESYRLEAAPSPEGEMDAGMLDDASVGTAP
jgi:glycosyltransferase involved in cell wall biosynthesis